MYWIAQMVSLLALQFVFDLIFSTVWWSADWFPVGSQMAYTTATCDSGICLYLRDGLRDLGR
jgi:hypothetical protein